MLIKIEAIIKEEQFEDVKDALNAMNVHGMTVSQVMGCGSQHGFKSFIRGSEVELALLSKIKIEVVVSSEEWEHKVIDCIRDAAFTGNVGDGKIFSYEIRTATRIRTNETGEKAIYSSAEKEDRNHD